MRTSGFVAIPASRSGDRKAHVPTFPTRNRSTAARDQEVGVARRGDQRAEEHPREQHLQQHSATGEAQGPNELGSASVGGVVGGVGEEG